MSSEGMKSISYVYLLGIGGIGMSALARYFKADGKMVCGYDKTPTPLTDELIREGIAVPGLLHLCALAGHRLQCEPRPYAEQQRLPQLPQSAGGIRQFRFRRAPPPRIEFDLRTALRPRQTLFGERSRACKPGGRRLADCEYPFPFQWQLVHRARLKRQLREC